MTCDWGDGSGKSPDSEPFNMTYNATDDIFLVPYDYAKHNEYTYECTMENHVSSWTFSKDVSKALTYSHFRTILFKDQGNNGQSNFWLTLSYFQITIFERILNFTVIPMWVPYGLDENIDDPIEGFGANQDQFPLDRNVTFFFDYIQGNKNPCMFRSNENTNFFKLPK
jgi:hypothetical protein